MLKEKTFEEAYQRLNEIAVVMKKEETTLDDKIKLYGEAMNLIKVCREKLENAKTTVMKLREENGMVLEEEFVSEDLKKGNK